MHTRIASTLPVLLILAGLASAQPAAQSANSASFEPLFNGRDLSGWETYLGIPEVPTLPFDPFGNWPAPIGRGEDPTGVYSVVNEDGEPAIRISGEIWGALISQREFENYHLRLQYKWGTARFAPRDEAPPNTGLLYHSVGRDGAFWSYWMRSAEFEIMEGRTGDFTSVDGVTGVARTDWDRSTGYPWQRYAPEASETALGGAVFRVAMSADFEKPVGEWNQLDLYVLGDAAVHSVNGEVVFRVTELAHDVDGQSVPLTRGALQFQSEGAEVFFRNIKIRAIESLAASGDTQ